ncbi:hypothetical protein HDU77_004809 [Chytriomyces hyalinus]|nr:hypothetical protein HDU77_004809 [Chytriomyces hyalinus]
MQISTRRLSQHARVLPILVFLAVVFIRVTFFRGHGDPDVVMKQESDLKTHNAPFFLPLDLPEREKGNNHRSDSEPNSEKSEARNVQTPQPGMFNETQTATPKPGCSCSSPHKSILPMQEHAYTSCHKNPTTTIILNVYQGTTEAFKIQLENSLSQKGGRLAVPHVWVMLFDSPHADAFENMYKMILRNVENGVYGSHLLPQLSLTRSSFNFKFHGRFLLGYMATTKYLLIADDDAEFGPDAVENLVNLMETKRRGVWGGFGHLRGDGVPNVKYRSWPNVGINRDEFDHYEMDYLSSLWFFEQSWLEYFFKERPWTWETGEDIHLSHTVRKYLHLNTYGGTVSVNPPALPAKHYSATSGHFLEMREVLFDHLLGRGNKIADVRPTIDTLVFVDSATEIHSLMSLMKTCNTHESPRSALYCNLGKTAAIFRGSCKDQNVNELVASAQQLCKATQCESFALKSEFKHPISYFNLAQDFGHDESVEPIPVSTRAADLIPSLVGVLNNVGPSRFLYHAKLCELNDGRAGFWTGTVKLGFEAYLQSVPNLKFSEGQHKLSDTDSSSSEYERAKTQGFMWKDELFIAHDMSTGNCISQ